MERWFKSIISLVLPDVWSKRKSDIHYSFNPVIDDLGLLDGGELSKNIDSKDDIKDPARRLFLIAYRYRNPLVHNPKGYSRSEKQLFLPAALAFLIAPVYKYQIKIKERLEGLIASPFESLEEIGLFNLINSERQRHLANFYGRNDWISNLKSLLETVSPNPNPYILLLGHEGMGKSALAARITEELSSMAVMGRNSGIVRKYAPWLPNTIIHFGKQSNEPQEIVKLLIAQINTLLLEPFPTSVPMQSIQGNLPDYLNYSAVQYTKARHNRLSDPLIYDSYGVPTENYQIINKRVSIPSDEVDFTKLRRDLYLALEKVAMERGHTVLIIDAVDEISSDGGGLQFLPDPLPVGVSALLTARPDIKVVNWLRANRDIQKINLTPLERSEIPFFTGLLDENGEVESRFNDRVWRTSKGWPLFVITAAKLIQDNRGHLDSIQLEGTMDSLFDRQRKEWKGELSTNPLPEILLLLTIFEPVASLELDLIQAFLERNGDEYNREQIKDLLSPVSYQIDGFDSNRIKLALKSFAEFLRERSRGKQDLKRDLSKITDWIANQQDIDVKIIALFLNYWCHKDRPKDLQTIAGSLVDKYISCSEADLLFQIYCAVRNQTGVGLIDVPVATKCLQAAAELGNTFAMVNLGNRFINGQGVKKDFQLGLDWLNKAAQKGNTRAMINIGSRLLDGEGVSKDLQSGEAWLLMAIEKGSKRAKITYALRLLDGGGIPKDSEKGKRLLLDLSDNGDNDAKFILAERYINGKGVSKDIETGERLLCELNDQKYHQACYVLANFYIDGNVITSNPKKGEAILLNLIEEGDKDAIMSLSFRLMYGKGLPQDVLRATQLLLDLANSGDPDAMNALGDLLLDGEVLSQNVSEGKRWLEKAANENHIPSMLNLANRFLEGDKLSRNQSEGKRWLVKATETGDARIMRILGARLLNGDKIPKDVKEGINWLKKAIVTGDSLAMVILANRILAGTGAEKDKAEAESLLLQACDKGEPHAWRVLGGIMLDGKKLSQDLSEGEIYLRKAADQGLPQAMCDLGLRLLNGDNLPKNIDEGKKWLERSCDEGYHPAKRTRAIFLINGDYYEPDVLQGEQLLREMITESNDVQARIALAKFLLHGTKLNKNVDEGIKLLQKAIDEGNTEAMVDLAQFYFSEETSYQDSYEGNRLLKKAAQEGNSRAMEELGERYLFGRGIDKNIEEGRKWLLRARDAGKPNALATLCRHYYLSRDFKLASEMALTGYKEGSSIAGNNLAFMLRRREVVLLEEPPSINQLLQPSLEEGDVIAVVNQALAIAFGYESEISWQEADRLIQNIQTYDEESDGIFSWWYDELVVKDDPEGHLVVGWFVRHGLAEDPDGWTVTQRLVRARLGGLDIPSWMDDPAPPKDFAQ